jgi:hypothetical protein
MAPVGFGVDCGAQLETASGAALTPVMPAIASATAPM